MIGFGVVDILLDPTPLGEDLNDARLISAIKFTAQAGPGTNPTVLGQHHGYLLTHLKPRLNTATQRAQQAGLNAAELTNRFSNQQNIQKLAQTFLAKRGDQDPNAVKSFSALAGHNLANHLIALSGEDQRKDSAQIQQTQQQAAATRQQARQAVHTAIKAVRTSS